MELQQIIKESFCRSNIQESSSSPWPFIALYEEPFWKHDTRDVYYEVFHASLRDVNTNDQILFLEASISPEHNNFVYYSKHFKEMLQPTLDYLSQAKVDFKKLPIEFIEANW